jgi:hypothetical protein
MPLVLKVVWLRGPATLAANGYLPTGWRGFSFPRGPRCSISSAVPRCGSSVYNRYPSGPSFGASLPQRTRSNSEPYFSRKTCAVDHFGSVRSLKMA